MDAAYLSALSALAVHRRRFDVGDRRMDKSAHAGESRTARSGRFATTGTVKDFIIAASRAYGKAILSNEPQIEDLVALYAMIGRMRVISSARTVECADKIMHKTIATYFAPNKTIHELNDLVLSGAGIDPLKEFGEVAREELRTLPSP